MCITKIISTKVHEYVPKTEKGIEMKGRVCEYNLSKEKRKKSYRERD